MLRPSSSLDSKYFQRVDDDFEAFYAVAHSQWMVDVEIRLAKTRTMQPTDEDVGNLIHVVPFFIPRYIVDSTKEEAKRDP